MSRSLPRLPAALAGCVLAALAACSESPPPAPPAPQEPPPAPTLDQLRSATISGVLGEPVTLANGAYEGPAAEAGAASHPSLVLLAPSVVTSDVDGRPGNEAVAALAAETGGSGSFLHVGVFALQDGKATSLATALIGDRVQLNRLWVEHGQIHMDVIEPGPSDPACCPSQLSRKVFALEAGSLKPVSNDVIGSVSVNLLAAADWMLVEMDGQPVPADKPPTLLVQYEKVVGFAGCNRYTGPLKETSPGAIKLGPLAMTKMACPAPASELEDKFVARMNQVTGYSFYAGQLALHWAGKDQQGVLLFAK